MGKTAIVFGATGLVGSYLVSELIGSKRYSMIRIFTRTSTGLEHVNLDERVVEIEKPDSYASMLSGDDLFICTGTTYKKTGSIKRVEEIDRDLPIIIARKSQEKGVKKIAVVSSIGANPGAKSFYMRIKGEMESGIRDLKFDRTVLVRPSMLLGKRKEFRIIESIGQTFARVMGFVLLGPLKKFRGIHGRDVARAMINTINTDSTQIVYRSDELKLLAETG